MKKIILTILTGAAFAAFADENYQALYWQVTADSLKSETYDYTAASYANLYATLNGEIVSTPSSVQASGFVELTRDDGMLSDSKNTWAVDLSGWNGGSSLEGAMFYVELFNEGGTSLATSEGINYANILSHIDRNFSGSGVPTTANGPAVFGTYAVPEPTSGLLMLLGLAGLALRRKRS